MDIYRIIAVEDSKIFQAIYKKVLQPDKFDLILLNEGKNACVEASRLNPHLIIMDINLPDSNGIELCRKLYNSPETENIPVIVVTSEGDIETLKNAYRAGAMDFIRKPFNEIELLIRVENMLRLVLKHRELVKLKQDIAVAEMGRSVAPTEPALTGHPRRRGNDTVLPANETIRRRNAGPSRHDH
jgi:DNA-binding response OmpR family regulator